MADRNSTVDRSAGDGPALPDFNSRPVQTPTAIGDFSQPPGPSIYPRRVRAARSRKYNLRSLDQTTGRSRHPSVVRTLTYESSPEHPSCSRPASNMAGNRVYMIDYQRPRPVPEKRRRRDSSDSDGEPDRTPRERTARRTLTRLLNHARVHLTLDERVLRCLSCGLLPSLPVTGICGHTRCTGCIRRHPQCPCGAMHTPWLMNVNVVVQEVIQKLVSTEQEVRQWLWETRDVSQLPHQQHHFMSGAPPPQFAAGLYVGLPPEAPDTNRNEGQKENGEKAGNNQQDVASVGTHTSDQEEKEKGNDDMEEDGAWALPEAERQRRKMEERMAKNRIPITPQARLQYGTYLMDEYRYKDAIPHLARAAIDSQIARPARRMLSQALLQLSRLYVLGEIEGELRQAISSQAASNWLRGRDFECIYCFDSFCRPITTPCGHTFCRPCLEKSLDYRGTCALCMQSLDLIQFSRVGVNQFLTSTLQSIGIERIPLPLDPHVIPILACTVTFPGMPCPLFLFDPRYWYMIRRILESNSRKFGMVASEREGTHSQYGTILEIRDCVHLQDGCTIVSTVGVSRFRVIERSVWDGWCDVARVVTITDIPVESEETVTQMRQLVRNIAYKAAVWFGGMGPELRANIETAFGSIPCLDTRGRWWTQPDGPAWLWWLISILPLNLEIKILMLATDSLLKRMRAVLRTLDTALAQPPHSVREYESALADWWMQRHL